MHSCTKFFSLQDLKAINLGKREISNSNIINLARIYNILAINVTKTW